MKTVKLFAGSLLALSLFAVGCDNGGGTTENTETVEAEQADTTTESVTYSLDTAQSNLEWRGEKVTGDYHEGTLKFKEGQITLQDEKITSGRIVMNMLTIENVDLAEDEEQRQKLEGHLASDDFFATEKYPEATFEINGTGTNDAGEKVVIGDLTIRDSTEQIQVPFDIEVQDNEVTATGTTTFDRSKFNIRYGSGTFFEDLGDKMIEDDVQIRFNLVATSEQEQ